MPESLIEQIHAIEQEADQIVAKAHEQAAQLERKADERIEQLKAELENQYQQQVEEIKSRTQQQQKDEEQQLRKKADKALGEVRNYDSKLAASLVDKLVQRVTGS